MAFIAAAILAQVAVRPFGIVVPSATELASYSMAASTFLALADVLRSGQHIRVHMILERASPRLRRILEMWALLFGGIVTGYFAIYTLEMVYDAFNYGEMSPGLLAIPIWIPQVGMAAGLVLLSLACLEGLWDLIRGRSSSHTPDRPMIEPAHTE